MAAHTGDTATLQSGQAPSGNALSPANAGIMSESRPTSETQAAIAHNSSADHVSAPDSTSDSKPVESTVVESNPPAGPSTSSPAINTNSEGASRNKKKKKKTPVSMNTPEGDSPAQSSAREAVKKSTNGGGMGTRGGAVVGQNLPDVTPLSALSRTSSADPALPGMLFNVNTSLASILAGAHSLVESGEEVGSFAWPLAADYGANCICDHASNVDGCCTVCRDVMTQLSLDISMLGLSPADMQILLPQAQELLRALTAGRVPVDALRLLSSMQLQDPLQKVPMAVCFIIIIIS